MIVFIKTFNVIHSVLTPIFDYPEQIATFMAFLKNEDTTLQVAFCRFEKNRWEISKETKSMHWPKSGLLYPSASDAA
jgi:hypothetical protein